MVTKLELRHYRLKLEYFCDENHVLSKYCEVMKSWVTNIICDQKYSFTDKIILSPRVYFVVVQGHMGNCV